MANITISELNSVELNLKDLSNAEASAAIGGESVDHPLHGVSGFILWSFTLGMGGDVYQAYPVL